MPPLSTAEQLHRDHRTKAAAPIVAYGDDAVLRVPAHVGATGAQRVLLVCGRRSLEASGAARMLPELEQVADVHRWSEFAPNIDTADLRVGLGVVRDYQPDLVLGVGGGSALDMAKLLSTFREVPDEKVLETVRTGQRTDERRGRLFLVPTTSGSGAEATHFAVVYIGNDKYSIGGSGMRPDVIVLDPTLSVSGSRYQRATSGIDAICQAIESLWATAATERSRQFARIALRLLLPAIERYVNEPGVQSARAMCIGSHFAGRAIDISRTTAAHALSYGITKTYGISHGHAVAITLGAFIEAHAAPPTHRLGPDVDPGAHASVMHQILLHLGAGTGAEGHSRFTTLLYRIGLDANLETAGADTPAKRQILAESVNAERLFNNPVSFTTGQLEELLEAK